MKVLAGQSIMDLTIEQSGSLTSLFDFAIVNNVSLTSLLEPTEDYNVPVVEVNKKVRTFYVNKNIRPATFYDISEALPPIPDEQGVGFWAIGVDFIVS